MKLVVLATTLFITASSVRASGLVLAKRAPSLYPRVSFQGGWAIEADSCPSNTTSCSNTGACCPNSTDCYTAGLAGTAVCCPNTSDCSDTAKIIPVCADPSWTLYIGNYNFFCCAAGQIGVLPDITSTTRPGVCVESGSNVPATALASLYSGGAGATGTPTPAAGSSTAALETSTVATEISTAASGVSTAAAGISAVSSSAASATGSSTSAASSPTSSTGAGSNPGTGKSNDSMKSSSVSVIGILLGFVLIPFGM